MRKLNVILLALGLLLVISSHSGNQCQAQPFPRDHFKVWRVIPEPASQLGVEVRDQFHTDTVDVLGIEFLANPVDKYEEGIQFPNDHLTWWMIDDADPISRRVKYLNQLDTAKAWIDSLVYLLVPTTKEGHPPYDSIDHYLCYRIANPRTIDTLVTLQDQFDATPESLVYLTSKYFCAPCVKNQEPWNDSTTHYVVYEIFPKHDTTIVRLVENQFINAPLTTVQSELLMIPSKKVIEAPSLTNWGMIVLLALLILSGIIVIRHRRAEARA